MDEHQRGIYKGSSRDEAPEAEPSLELAIQNAYEKGRRAKIEAELTNEEGLTPEGEPITFQYRVEAIFIEGHNPPSDYKVYLSDS